MGLQQTTIQYLNHCYSHYYICNYLPVSAGRDTLSYSLLRFKRGLQPDLSGWIDCSLEILAAGLPSAIPPASALPIPPNSTIVRALHHNETAAIPYGSTALDQLGRALAAQFECRYSPALLHKSRLTREIKAMTRQQREAELAGLYYIDPSVPGAPPSATPSYYNSVAPPAFLIIDDVLTTATTIKAIIGAILQHYPCSPLTLFTLARADYDATLNKSAPLKGRNYRLEQGMDWLVAEENAPYYSSRELKDRIRRGAF